MVITIQHFSSYIIILEKHIFQFNLNQVGIYMYLKLTNLPYTFYFRYVFFDHHEIFIMTV
jgi:hypothetical protein